MAYRRKTGPLDVGSKLEVHLATLQAMVVQAMGGKAQPGDFLHGAEPEAVPDKAESGIDMSQAIAAFKTAGGL